MDKERTTLEDILDIEVMDVNDNYTTIDELLSQLTKEEKEQLIKRLEDA